MKQKNNKNPRAKNKKKDKFAGLRSLLNTGKGKVLAFAVVFGVLGVSYLAYSSAATPPKYFDPAGTLNRQAAAAFLYRAAGSPAPVATTKCGAGKAGPYTDVPATYVFCKEIEWAGNKGIMTPYAGNNMNPTQAVARQAMAAFMYRAAGSPAYTAPAKSAFPDVPTNHTFYKEISWMAANNITSGYGDGTFKPAEVVARQAAAAFIYRKAGSPAVNVPQIFADVPSTNPFYAAIQWMGKEDVAQGYKEDVAKQRAEETAKAAKAAKAAEAAKAAVAAKTAADAKSTAAPTYQCVADSAGNAKACTKQEYDNQAKFFGTVTALSRTCISPQGTTYACNETEYQKQVTFFKAASDTGKPKNSAPGGQSSNDLAAYYQKCYANPKLPGCTPKVSTGYYICTILTPYGNSTITTNTESECKLKQQQGGNKGTVCYTVVKGNPWVFGSKDTKVQVPCPKK